jgi:hypothetical protein
MELGDTFLGQGPARRFNIDLVVDRTGNLLISLQKLIGELVWVVVHGRVPVAGAGSR